MGAMLQKSGGAGGRKGRQRRRSSSSRALASEINVTPFVDVMLVLLIIFMVTAPLLTSTIVVDLPKSKSAVSKSDEKPIEVTIKPDGTVYLGDDLVAIDNLASKISLITAGRPEGKESRIFIRGDKLTQYGAIAEVLETLKSAGFLKIGLKTQIE